MAELLGIGLSHYPPLSGIDSDMAGPLRARLEDPAIPAHAKDPAGWPAVMLEEWGDDRGVAAAAEHRASLVEGFDVCRKAIDDFEPDLVIIWGDDQYENFREDLIPPYSVLAYPDMVIEPWAHLAGSSAMEGKANVWGEDASARMAVKGAPREGRWLASQLLDAGIDVSYAYRPLHHPGLAHAFLNTLLYLDYHRRGFPYPVLCFPINCYGRRVVAQKGYVAPIGAEIDYDPPSPPPWRVMDMGAAVGRALRDSDLRVALVASSSWSHAFMVDKTWRMQPDIEADRELYDALAKGDLDVWRTRSLDQLEDSGQQELLNWYALLGAMEAVGRPSPTWSSKVETYVFNSPKVFAVFAP
jgi:hypothetical protein